MGKKCYHRKPEACSPTRKESVHGLPGALQHPSRMQCDQHGSKGALPSFMLLKLAMVKQTLQRQKFQVAAAFLASTLGLHQLTHDG